MLANTMGSDFSCCPRPDEDEAVRRIAAVEGRVLELEQRVFLGMDYGKPMVRNVQGLSLRHPDQWNDDIPLSIVNSQPRQTDMSHSIMRPYDASPTNILWNSRAK